MGRTRIVLDPDGYQRCAEPGFHWWINGADLYKLLSEGNLPNGNKETAASGLFNPPGSEWLTMRPVQMDPEQYRSLGLAERVLKSSLWTKASGLSVTEFEPTRKPSGATNSDNLWMWVAAPSSFTPLVSETWSAIFSLAQVSMPSGFGTVMTCTSTPDSQTLTDWDYHPFLQWRATPGPDSAWAFQFGNLTFVFANGLITVLQFDATQTSHWRKLGQVKASDAEKKGQSPGALTSWTAVDDSLLAMPVGHEDVYLFFGRGSHVKYTLQKVLDQVAPGVTFHPSAPWAIAMAPGAKLGVQVQVVDYGWADFTTLANPNKLFDLGSYYKPTQPPKVRIVNRFETSEGDSSVIDYVDNGDGSYKIQRDFSGGASQIIQYSLVTGGTGLGLNQWDGTHASCSLALVLTGGSPGVPGFLSPQIRRLELRFPVVLEDRPNTPLFLTDHEFSGWKAETTYPSPLLGSHGAAKQIEIHLWDAGVRTLVDAGMDKRDYYPVHIEELTAENVWTVRVAGWVTTLELTEHKTKDKNDETAIREHTLDAGALLVRLDNDWAVLPQIVDPDEPNGFVEHTLAVEESINQSGFDTSDTSIYKAQSDPGTGTDLARLPGTWGTGSGILPKRVASPWSPDWDKTRLQYVLMISQDFRGWVLREDLDGLIRYHQDAMLEFLENGTYYSIGNLYWSKASAILAGVPGQYIMAEPERHRIPPQANAVRVTMEEPGDSLIPHYIDRWLPSIDTIDDPDHNFMGEWVVKGFTTKLAVEERVLSQVCRIKVMQLCRRSSPWSVKVPLPPWRFANPIEVGNVITVDGTAYGAHLIIHMEVEQLESRPTTDAEVYITRLTLDKLPTQATAGTMPGDYPGQGR